MPEPNAAELLELVARLPHLTPQQLDDLRRRGWLTAFQVERVQKGQAGSLLIDRYLLVEPLGAGGMGAVYKARHLSLDCFRAVKVIRGDQRTDAGMMRRFQEEMRQIAQLDHPNIVKAHDGGQHGDTLFLVMELLEGIDLQQMRDGRVPINLACDYIRQAALGLHHAHKHNLVHRDIKPSNLMLTVPGTRDAGSGIDSAVPTAGLSGSPASTIKILDFGLARRRDPGALSGASGILVGTPGYMAPEQIASPGHEDARSDLYSLGCTLYFLLTGHGPYQEVNAGVVLHRNLLGEYEPLNNTRPEIPRELSELVGRLMSREREARPASAKEVAEALEQLCRDSSSAPAAAATAPELSLAPRKPYRSKRRIALAIISALFVIMVALFLTLQGGWSNPDGKEDGRTPHGDGVLFQLDLAGIEKGFDELPEHLVAIIGDRHGRHWGDAACVAIQPGGRKIVSGGNDERIRLWEPVQLGPRTILRQTGALSGVKGNVAHLAIDRGGRWLAACVNDHTLQVWEMARTQEPRLVQAHQGLWKGGLAFSPNGQYLACATSKGLRLYRTSDWKPLDDLPDSPANVVAIAFSSDGQYLAAGIAAALGQRSIWVWNTATRQPVTVPATSVLVRDLAFLADDSSLLVSALSDADLTLVNLKGQQVTRKPVPDEEQFRRLAEPADDGTLATWRAARDRIWLWDLKQIEPRISFAVPQKVSSASLSRDGKTVAVSGKAGLVQLWSRESGDPVLLTSHSGHVGPVHAIALSPDGMRLTTGGADGTIRLWDLSATPIRELANSPLCRLVGPVSWLRYTPDGQWLLAWAATVREVRVFDAITGLPRESVPSFAAPNYDLALSVDGKTLLAAVPRESGSLDCYSVATGRKLPLPIKEPLRESLVALDFSRDGKLLATVTGANEVSVWDMATGRRVDAWPCGVLDGAGGKDQVMVVRFSPDGKRLAVGSQLGRLELIDVERATVAGSHDAHRKKHVTALVFSPDGKRLASTGRDGGIRIWDLEHAEDRIDYPPLPGPIHGLVFAKDGRHLITANADGTAFILRLPPAR